MRLEHLKRLLRHLWSAITAFVTAMCLMAAGSAQAGGSDGALAHSSVTPGKVKSEV